MGLQEDLNRDKLGKFRELYPNPTVMQTPPYKEPTQSTPENSHYDGYHVLRFIQEMGLTFDEGNVVKYVCRHSRKGQAKDLDKAMDYLQKLKEFRYPGASSQQ